MIVRRSFWLGLLGCCLLLPLSACSSTTSRVASGEPFGYALFYVPPGKTYVERPRIYSVENEKFTPLGETSYLRQGKPSVKYIKESPGVHEYEVRLGSFRRRVQVPVRIGYISPIQIAVIGLGSEQWGGKAREMEMSRFRVEMKRGDPYPIPDQGIDN